MLGYESSLKRFLARFFRRPQDIEDIAQEAYLRAFDANLQGGEIRSPKAYLFRIAKNLALNELTRKSRNLTHYIEESGLSDVVERTHSLEDEAIEREKLALFCRAVSTLPLQCRRAFLMRKVQGLSHKEISELMGISVSTVEKHVASGLLRCSAYLRDMGYEDMNPSGVGKPRSKQGKSE